MVGIAKSKFDIVSTIVLCIGLYDILWVHRLPYREMFSFIVGNCLENPNLVRKYFSERNEIADNID